MEVIRENGNQVADAVGKLGDVLLVLSKGDGSRIRDWDGTGESTGGGDE